MLDGYYEYNFNKPKTSTGGPGENGPILSPPPIGSATSGRTFDNTDNSFILALADVRVGRAVNDTSRLGFAVDLGFGPTADAIVFGTSDQSTKNILQAYGSYLVPVGAKDLTVDAGKFFTHVGYEAVEPAQNWNYSRSDCAQYFTPIYHTGVRAAYPVSPTLTATGYIYNGWEDAAADNNVPKAFGFAIAWTPKPKFNLVVNGLASTEPDSYGVNTVNRAKDVVEPILTYTFSTALTAVADLNFDFGGGPTPNNASAYDGSWSAEGYAGYLHYAFESGSSLTLRGEFFDDYQGFLTAVDGEKGGELTLTYGIKSPLFPGAETRFEYRYDDLNKAGLLPDANDGFTRKRQSTVSVSELLSF